jgi:hypothetical protein
LLHAPFQIGDGLVLASLKQIHFLQMQRGFFAGGLFDFTDQAIFHPFDRSLDGLENPHRIAAIDQPGLLEKFQQVATVG